MKQLPLEVVRGPKWRVIFASESAAAEGKSSNTCGVDGDARPCLRTKWFMEENEEETEELSFIRSAVSEPRWTLHMCDNKCRQEGFKFCLLVAIVTEEGGKACTINLCMQCYSEKAAETG